MPRPLLHSAVILTCAVLLAACASPPRPQSERKRTILVTDHDDTRVGREASGDVEAEIGVLDDPELTAYVSRIGHKLLRGVPRRSFQYHFAVVDQVEPNAFALPGGYIFVSRGLLALANSEDELACVIGHEITHAAQRHAAAQQAMGRRQSPLAGPWVRAGNMARYGREMEHSADRGGQILCAAAGYDPRAMATFLKTLAQTERLEVGYSRNPSFFDTHPGAHKRASVNAVRASELRWRRDPSLGDTRASLMSKLDGAPLGQRPETGVFKGDHFLHADLDFHLRFPVGWKKSNTNRAVGATAPRGEAVVFLMADVPPGDPREVAEAWVEKTRQKNRIAVEESKPVTIGRLGSWRVRFVTGTGAESLTSYVTFIPQDEATWRITGISRSFSSRGHLQRTLLTARSFRPLNAEERASLTATRLRIVRARPGEDLATLRRRSDNAWNDSETAIYNGLLPSHRFKGGELVKIARVEPYVRNPTDPTRPPRPDF